MTRRYLSQTDTIMWTVEADPMLRSTIMGVAMLTKAPRWKATQQRVRHLIDRVESLRQRVVPVPMRPNSLRWEDVDHVDLDYHLRRVGAPGKGTTRDLLNLARSLAAVPFDRARPLWEFTLVDGLDGGGAALLMKTHHVVTDGIGAVQLAMHLFDFAPNSPKVGDPAATETPARARAATGAWSMLRSAVGDILDHDLRTARNVVTRTAPTLIPSLTQAIRDPATALGGAVETAKSVGRVVMPVLSTKSTVMTERSMDTFYDTIEVPLEALHGAGAAAGGTLNDAFLGGITGGLRRYHEAHGTTVDELRVAMPVSLRSDADDEGGNHITVLRFAVPAGITEPAERVQALHEVGQQMRHERSLAHTESIAGVLNLMPRGVLGSMLKKIDFLASNVPGSPVTAYLAGSKIERIFPFGPTSGSSMNVTLMSYDGTCCIGVHLDTAAVTDPDLMMECLHNGFAEVVALTSEH